MKGIFLGMFDPDSFSVRLNGNLKRFTTINELLHHVRM